MKFSIDSKIETSNNIPEKLITTAIVKSVGKHEAATFYFTLFRFERSFIVMVMKTWLVLSNSLFLKNSFVYT